MKRLIITAALLSLGALLSAQNIYQDQYVTIDKIEEGSYKISYLDEPNYSSMYVIEGKKKALLIDTGDKADLDLKRYVAMCTTKPYSVVLTHTHGDHLGAVGQFDEVYVNKKEEMRPLKSAFKGRIKNISDGQTFNLGGKKIQALEITGHTEGGMIFCDYQTGNCYTGDCFGTGQVWLQMGKSRTPISDYLGQVKKMLGYMAEKHIVHLYTGHFGQEECIYGINYIQDMATLAENMLKGNYTSAHHNRSAETSNTCMSSLRRATIVFNPDKVK